MREVAIKNLGYYIRQAGSKARAAVKRGLHVGGLHAVAVMQKRTVDLGVFNLGEYKRGWKFSVQDGHLFVFNNTPQAPIIEEGRRKGARMPPRGAIEKWARRKLQLSPKKAKAAAFPIARAIAMKGIKGKHVLRDAIPMLTKLVRQDVIDELRRTVKAL